MKYHLTASKAIIDSGKDPQWIVKSLGEGRLRNRVVSLEPSLSWSLMNHRGSGHFSNEDVWHTLPSPRDPKVHISSNGTNGHRVPPDAPRRQQCHLGKMSANNSYAKSNLKAASRSMLFEEHSVKLFKMSTP